MKNLIILLLSLTIITSCNSITEKDITVIDGIKLGDKSVEEFNNQMKSLGNTPKEIILIDYPSLLRKDNSQKLVCQLYTTNAFSSAKYNLGIVNHMGIIVPSVSQTNSCVERVIISLVHTIPLKDDFRRGFSQIVSEGFIEEVKNKFTQKYGSPTDTVYTTEYDAYYFSNKGFQNIRLSNTVDDLVKYIWVSKGFTIELFLGGQNSSYSYIKGLNSYMLNFVSDIDYSKDALDEKCYEFSYVQYTLNNKAVESLGLNKSRL